jgi:cytochrome c55X
MYWRNRRLNHCEPNVPRATELLAAVLILAASAAGAATPGGDRQAALLYLLRQDCGSCHGSTLRGGLAPALLPQNLAATPDEALIEAILDGRPGTPMPPWGFEISPDEAAWMVRQLKGGLAE